MNEQTERNDFFQDITIGLSEGLMVPFALAAFLSAAVNSTSLIILVDIAAIAAGSIAMGLGGYMVNKTEIDHYNAELKRESNDVEQLPKHEKEEIKKFYSNLGLSRDVQEQAANEVEKDKKSWFDFIMKYELDLAKPDQKSATKTAFNIGFSYIIGGIITLSPYFFVHDVKIAFKVSSVLTLICLFIFGYFKSRLTGDNPWVGAIRIMMIGATTAACAFGIARLIEQ